MTRKRLKKGFLCLHLGAGFHSEHKKNLYKKLCGEAIQIGVTLLNNNAECVEVATKVASYIENSPLTNAGFGSNLTEDGSVECEAAIMESVHNTFGAAGCVQGLKNPVEAARMVLERQQQTQPFGLIAPMLLVGDSVTIKANEYGLETVDNQSLISDKAMKSHQKFKILVQKHLGKTPEGIQSKTPEFSGFDLSEPKGSRTSEIVAPSISPNFYITDKTCSRSPESHSYSTENFSKRRKIDTVNHNDENNPNTRFKSNDKTFEHSATCRTPKFTSHIGASADGFGSLDKIYTNSNDGRETTSEQQSCISKENTVSFIENGLNEEISLHETYYNDDADDVDNDQSIFERNDTIGVVCVDQYMNIATAVSSGGIALKQKGRLGPCTQFGAGCWAFKYNEETSMGCCCSGTGEAIMRTQLAEKLCRFVHTDVNNLTELDRFVRNEFINSPYLPTFLEQRLCGLLLVTVTKNTEDGSGSGAVDFYLTHTTDSFCVSYISSGEKQANFVLSRLKEDECTSTKGFHFTV